MNQRAGKPAGVNMRVHAALRDYLQARARAESVKQNRTVTILEVSEDVAELLTEADSINTELTNDGTGEQQR